ALAAQLVTVVRELRGLRLRKNPGISETVDWARALAVLGARELDASLLAETVNVVLKYERDLNRALEVLPRLAPAGRAAPAPDGHVHSEDPAHRHVQAEEPAHDHVAAPQEPDAWAVRGAADGPVLHDTGHGPQRPGEAE